MSNGIYAASTGLLARTQELDLAANNLANANTSGFRGERVSFKTQMMTASSNASTRAVSSFGVLGSPRTDFSQGSLQQTGNPLDLALEGSGFFAVQAPTGVQYTRNGNFHLTKDGALVTAQGFPVLGDRGPITLPQGRCRDQLRRSHLGQRRHRRTIAAHRLRCQRPAHLPGRRLFLGARGRRHSRHPAHRRQGSLESSNINPVECAVSLIEIQRNAEMMQRALTTFHNEFDRTAAEDLPKV